MNFSTRGSIDGKMFPGGKRNAVDVKMLPDGKMSLTARSYLKAKKRRDFLPKLWLGNFSLWHFVITVKINKSV